MVQLLEIFGFLSVLLRAATLGFQSLTIGGIVFLVFVARRLALGAEAIWQASLRMILWSAVALTVAQIASVITNTLILMRSADMTLAKVGGANFVAAGGLAAASALTIAALAAARQWRGHPGLLLPAALILTAAVMTSHAAARMEHRLPLVVFSALHQAAAAIWIGGLPYLLIAVRRAPTAEIARELSAKFSQLALLSVAVLGTAGLALGVGYIGSWDALYGTTYGVMAMAKVLLFGCLLILGGLNFWIVRRSRSNKGSSLASLRRFGEAEIGIGLTVILAAASLTSQPPAADLTVGRVTAGEIVERMTPHPPRLKSSDLQELGEPLLQTLKRAAAAGAPLPESYVPGQAAGLPQTPADMAWSEYNHHWAGLVVLMIGFLAFAARAGHAPWARNWPLMFLGLAAFLFFRNDPDTWPIGPNGFWESFADPEVVQHRVFLVLIIVFAIFEWGVQTGRVISQRAALVFPIVCALGGALLLTHSHALGNIKEELLVELSHVPLALLGVAAGWSRWLELRLPAEDRTRRVLSWIWPVCFILIGAVLLNYRES